MKTNKSTGVTPTEQLLYKLCEDTFLKLWSYPNPVKNDGKELCDVIAVFENHVFVFFDRESRKFDNPDKAVDIQWDRWLKEVIDKQTKTALGAERYLKNGGEIFLDDNCTIPFPIKLPNKETLIVHKIIVAHGAKEACEKFFGENSAGSLVICYGDKEKSPKLFPFMLTLSRENPVHVFDTYNLDIILNELDTFYDFSTYLREKEEAISRYDTIMYCGEEDLLAHYLLNWDENTDRNIIGTLDTEINFLSIMEGEWQDLIKREDFQKKKEEDKDSYIWDELLQQTSQNAIDGTLIGQENIITGKNPLVEMAKEPRSFRTLLGKNLIRVIDEFPESDNKSSRLLSVISSFYSDTLYVILQLKPNHEINYETEYRPVRRKMLAIACGVAKNRFPEISKIIGITFDSPKYTKINSEDFILLDCSDWGQKDEEFYNEKNKDFGFFQNIKDKKSDFFELPHSPEKKQIKIGRNEKCPCGSGLKYKKCCNKK
ncbi:MAG: hypothetical protein C0602_05860 [Denitrovibrio sp.]|nr:MAG: hypothetical protein C0602_05860 [Denitrovibrio sp.]